MTIIKTKSLLDIVDSLLLLSLSLALSSKVPIGILLEQFIYMYFIASASNSDSESNELKCLLLSCMLYKIYEYVDVPVMYSCKISVYCIGVLP